MTKRKKPIDLVEKLRQKYEKEAKKSGCKTQDTWLNVKSILYTGLIALAVVFVVISGVVLIPLAILLIAGLMVFIVVKAVLSEKDEDTDEEEEEKKN